jgi:SAM-dependent methyltransferase
MKEAIDLTLNDINLKEHGFSSYKECPLCASEKIKNKYKVSGYTITKCLKCSVFFVREILTEDFLKKSYQNVEGHFTFYVHQDNKKCLNYYYNKIKTEIEKMKPAKGTILDVGCSAGFFLEQMNGWERHGIEVAEDMGTITREKIGDNIFIGTFETYPTRKNYFDVITLQDVFDHFIDPNKNLQKCYDMLKPGGLLIVKVHNISCLYAKITGANFYAIIPPSHLFYFNKKSLKCLLNKVGFTLYKSKFIGHLFQLKTLFYRLSKGKSNTTYYKIFEWLNNNVLGKIKFYKNLNDIITVFAIKERKK